MPILERPKADLYYDVCDIVPPWQDRETVLFLNGLAIDSDIWVTWLPALVDRYRIIRTDLRGFGRSFVPAAGETWCIEDIAQDVLDVMAATGTGRVHFVGESTGGTVGLYLAAQVERLRAMPNAELAVIANARHGVSHSHGAECARILRRFIDGLGNDR